MKWLCWQFYVQSSVDSVDLFTAFFSLVNQVIKFPDNRKQNFASYYQHDIKLTINDCNLWPLLWFLVLMTSYSFLMTKLEQKLSLPCISSSLEFWWFSQSSIRQNLKLRGFLSYIFTFVSDYFPKDLVVINKSSTYYFLWYWLSARVQWTKAAIAISSFGIFSQFRCFFAMFFVLSITLCASSVNNNMLTLYFI